MDEKTRKNIELPERYCPLSELAGKTRNCDPEKCAWGSPGCGSIESIAAGLWRFR